MCVGLYFAISGIPSVLALGRFGSHPCKKHFGWLRSIRGQGIWRMWHSAEVAVPMMRRMMVALELKRRSAAGRVPEAGAHIARVVSDDIEDEEGGGPFASGYGALRELLSAARRFANGDDEELAGMLLAFVENRVEVAGQHLRKLQPPSAYSGITSPARIVATAAAIRNP
jgi:hypothetical protein